jgi:PAS domain S-box-containing protein
MPENKTATILIVDDTEASRYAVGRLLRQARFTVWEADTGTDALRLAAQKPDLVILDVNLPDMSGYEVCQRLKADPGTASMPVLHLSASFVRSEDRSEGLEGGADGYLTYPLEPRELVASVEALLRVRKAEQSMRAQRELLRVTLDSIGDGVVATDAEGVVTFINSVAQQLTGWTEEAVGKPLDDVFHIVNEETGAAASNPVARVIRTGRIAGLANHTILIARDGTRRPIDDTAAPIRDDEGHFVGVVLVFRDITVRRQLEREVQQRTDDLVERDRRKDEFLAMLAHELRNPLAPIRNTLQVLKIQLADNPVFVAASNVMERQVAHLARLVEDLMDVSRITRGKFELRKERTDLAALVSRAVEGVRHFLEERQHTLEVALPSTAVTLEADSARVEQILANLLTNAAKYTPQGGHVWVTATREGREAVLRVRDDGIGIRAEVLPQLFELFEQADRVPGHVSEGLGIGLSLSRTLAEMHGGSLSGASAGPGKGSEFVVRLPALEDRAGLGLKAAGEQTVAATQPVRVLICDDNIDSAQSMAMLLRLSGHEVRTTHEGLQALEAAAAFRPQAAFLDIGLPGSMDGYELARRLRRSAGLEKMVLIAMTGFGAPEDVEQARAAGFDHHLTKPAAATAVARLLAGVAQTAS